MAPPRENYTRRRLLYSAGPADVHSGDPPIVPGKKQGAAAETVLARNRAASHEYHLLDRWEAGIALTGTEVKSIRAGQVNLKEAYAAVRDGEVYLHQAHVSPYLQGNRENPDPVRVRKLLLHASEIRKIERLTTAGGTTLVPLRLYLKDGRVKVELALAKGKKAHDKRDAIRAKDLDREMARARTDRG
jgi:SsrA-binding protein